MKRLLLVLSLLLASIVLMTVSPVLGQDVDELIYMTEDYPPWNFEQDGEIRGISPDLLRLIWKKMGYPEQSIELLPWSRGYRLALKNRNHVLMSMTRTAEREPLFKWVGPISTSKYVLIKLSKNKISVNSLEDAKKYRIGTIREDATEQILESSGFNKEMISSVSKIKQAVRMLQAGNIDLLAHEQRSFESVLEKENYSPAEFESVVLLSEEKDHYAFHKDTPDALIQRFQVALDSLEQEHKAILDYYFK